MFGVPYKDRDRRWPRLDAAKPRQGAARDAALARRASGGASRASTRLGSAQPRDPSNDLAAATGADSRRRGLGPRYRGGGARRELRRWVLVLAGTAASPGGVAG